MGVVVQKYGGTSVATPERIRRVAERIARSTSEGNRTVVVVSAMGHSTDELMNLALQVAKVPHARELDMLLSAGERISMALISMALIEMGYDAISFTGSQAGIVTDTTHTKARIVEVKARRIEEALAQEKIVIVAGFQGVSTAFDVTTLGRGGSDTTAVALAAALGADVCEIYTDVEGVYTADPRRVPNARKLKTVTFEEMLEMSASGAGVLVLRAVEYARTHNVVIHCRSSFSDEPGTLVIREEEGMEKALVTAVTHDTSEAMVRIRRVPDRPGVAASIFGAIAARRINVDMIVQNVSEEGKTDVTFTMPKEDLARSDEALRKIVSDIGAEGYTEDPDIAKLSLIGAGMKSDPGVAAEMFEALAEAGINIEMISTSSIRISCVVRAEDIDRAVRVIHDRFQLSDEPSDRRAPEPVVT
ncbi:MAG: aspartate kinase [Actinomycetota bacterium]|nr:aspartate kinase [Actinomycetota bacterium]